MGRFAARHPLGAAAALLLLLLTAAAVLAEQVAPYDPVANDFLAMFAPPSSRHWLGTDAFGRDVLSRIIFGARTALLVGVLSAAAGATAGGVLGVASAYFGGTTDLVVQRLADILISFPLIVLALAIVAILGSGTANLIIAIALSFVPRAEVVVRGAALAVRRMAYVEAAQAVGAGSWRIIVRHMVPNVVAPYLVLLTAFVGQAILLEASLSFLGLGVTEPTPAWGLMLSGAAVEFVQRAPWMAVFPGLAITVTVLAVNVLGDALRDALDPRLRT
ncbi:MAG: ABC transporter permease [Armatimonadota bacterium]|nr:ABC transporter permease [Armatimonadota bacterium]MDR7403979.1 ABC transporter permease [Armatimonadota bacterium]MDR7472059.1 ABC transporter permease [Armatimonadota bacterium]MDR7507154.1 ABC transporter permease [Armatimonadota bacterium]MDR7509755.1 ABC transporter permease [Armatimonadota bacterium]